MLNQIIVKVQSHLAKVYGGETVAVAIIVKEIDQTVKALPYGEQKLIAMTMTPEQIINKYYPQ